jgi:hypothetical protein
VNWIIEHWAWVSSAGGGVALLALMAKLWDGLQSLAIAAWERDQCHRQMAILQTTTDRLSAAAEHRLSAASSESSPMTTHPSNAPLIAPEPLSGN